MSVLKTTLDEWLADTLRAVMAGEVDIDEHAYITCTDEVPAINLERGCPRCIVQEFLQRTP